MRSHEDIDPIAIKSQRDMRDYIGRGERAVVEVVEVGSRISSITSCGIFILATDGPATENQIMRCKNNKIAMTNELGYGGGTVELGRDTPAI